MTALLLSGALIEFSSSLLKHSCISAVCGSDQVSWVQKALHILMTKAVALNLVPKRHINLVAGQRIVPPATLKLWRAWMFVSWSVAKTTLLKSDMIILKSCVVALVGQLSGFNVDRIVFVAKVVVSLCCKIGLPINKIIVVEVIIVYSLFLDEGLAKLN